MSSVRRGAELLLESIRAFRSVLLKVMVAVGWRWLQRGYDKARERLDSIASNSYHSQLPYAQIMLRDLNEIV